MINQYFQQILHLPLKFRLFILKFRGAKGLEDTILPPEKKKKKSSNMKHFPTYRRRCIDTFIILSRDRQCTAAVWINAKFHKLTQRLLGSHHCFNQQWKQLNKYFSYQHINRTLFYRLFCLLIGLHLRRHLIELTNYFFFLQVN